MRKKPSSYWVPPLLEPPHKKLLGQKLMSIGPVPLIISLGPVRFCPRGCWRIFAAKKSRRVERWHESSPENTLSSEIFMDIITGTFLRYRQISEMISPVTEENQAQRSLGLNNYHDEIYRWDVGIFDNYCSTFFSDGLSNIQLPHPSAFHSCPCEGWFVSQE